MKSPNDFMKVTIISLIIYAAVVFSFGVLSFLAFGQGIQSPITDNVSILGTDGELTKIDS